MSCKICGRSSCTQSFHSLEEQELFVQREAMPDDVNLLRRMVQEAAAELIELKKERAGFIDALERAGVIGAGCGPYVEWGMSLRDYFAGQALTGMFAQPDQRTCPKDEPFRDWQALIALEDARTCYAYADAMLAARAALANAKGGAA